MQPNGKTSSPVAGHRGHVRGRGEGRSSGYAGGTGQPFIYLTLSDGVCSSADLGEHRREAGNAVAHRQPDAGRTAGYGPSRLRVAGAGEDCR
jgi:hypothetical protein